MANPLTLKLILAGATKAVNELRPLDKQSRTTAEGLKKSRDALKLLNTQLGQIDGIQKQQAALDRQSRALRDLDSQLNAVIAREGLKSAQASRLAQQLLTQTLAYDKQRTSLAELQLAAQRSGIGLGHLGAEQIRLRTEVQATNGAISQQKARLEALGAQQARRAALQQRYSAMRGTGGNAAVAGATGIGIAYGARRAVGEPLGEVRHYETSVARIEALGLGKDESDKAVEYAKRMKTFGTSMNDNLGLMLDATTAFADVHHAEMVMPTLTKMKFANKAMFGDEQGSENERKFMDMLKVIEARNGLSSKEEFTRQADMVQRVITATGGRVDSTQWLDFVKRGGIAAKGLSSEAMYYQLEPIVQIMGGASAGVATMSAYQNLYQGRTTKRAAANLQKFGLIGDPSKVKHDKAGQVSFMDPGALKGSDLFRTNQFEWMEKVLLPALAAKGITDPDKINDAIGSIFSNRTASSLFSQMFLMRDQIHKNAKLNAGAFGIDQLDERAQQSLSGKELAAQARFHDAMQQAGQALLPTYIKLLNMAGSALQRITDFAQQNPVLASYIGKAVLWIGLLAAGFGALGLAAAAIFGPWAILRYGIGMFGVKLAAMPPLVRLFTGTIGLAASGVAWLARAVAGAVPVLIAAGTSVARFGLTLLANPVTWYVAAVVAALALIGGAVYLIYQNWGPIKAWFSNLWDSITGGVSAAVVLIRGGLDGAVAWLGSLATRFVQAGADLMDGLANGITSRLAMVRDAISSAADGAIGWFKDKLGIRSPSRVFIEAGANIGEGAALGIDRTRPLLRAAALGLAGATAGALPAMAAAFPLAEGIIDTRPPLAAAAGGRAAAQIVVQGDTITIQINAGPGSDPQAFARAISAELDRREAAKRARMRAAFIDYDNG